MTKPLFTGVCTALVTPFLDGKVNYPMAKTLLKRQVDAGIKSVVVSGTTGESPTLSDQEKINLVRCCKEQAGEDCLIIAGTGSNSTAHNVELSKQAEDAGADALLIVAPYYNKATDDGLFAHYVTIAHNVSIPVILYNVPSRTGIDIPVSVYKRLCRIPNIIGVKEASGEISKVTRIKNACLSDFQIWTGNDDMTVPAMSLGASGVISVASNICPEQMVAMTSAALNDDFETAARIQKILQPLIDLLFSETNPIPVKEAMKCLGYDCGGYRLPLCKPSKENIERIKQFFL